MVFFQADMYPAMNCCLHCKGRASLVAQTVKCLPAMWKARFDPWVGTIPWRRKWQPTLVPLPGKFHARRSLAGYSSCGCRVRHNWTTSLFFHSQRDQNRRDIAWCLDFSIRTQRQSFPRLKESATNCNSANDLSASLGNWLGQCVLLLSCLI